MMYAKINNTPKDNIKEIFDCALLKSYNYHVDEFGTKDNPNIWTRKQSKLSYEEAFEIIKNNEPYSVISYRNESYLSNQLNDFWEFCISNNKHGEYGTLFIWISVNVKESLEIFEKFKLNINEYGK